MPFSPVINLDLEELQPDSIPIQDAEKLLTEYQEKLYRRTDRLFVWLFIFQWILGIVFALCVTPRTWIGTTSLVHIHVWAALFLGLAIIVPPCYLILFRPGKAETRQAVAIAQALTSIFLIHLTGGRIETHFHVFGSLAFLAMYRDWRVLVTMTAIVATDHIVRGLFWPQSVYGILTGTEWRWLEHAAWVIFEDIFLIQSCWQSQIEMCTIAERQAQLAALNKTLDGKVVQRTEQLTLLQAELVQSDKMASLGQMAAGVAHEINNPIGFVISNLGTLSKYVIIFKQLLEQYAKLSSMVRSEGVINGKGEILEQIETICPPAKLDYILEDIDSLLIESKDGTKRVQEIVQGLKSFSRVDEAEIKEANINECIESTLKIVWNELKYKCTVNIKLGDIPNIRCNPGQLNQVFLNLFVNAVHAIPEQGEISIDTKASSTHIIVQITDTGVGIPQEALSKIFDPFFTTKPVGEGTGLGLAISYGIIAKHQGTIEVDSTVGRGSTFTITLPIQPYSDLDPFIDENASGSEKIKLG